MQTTNKAPKPPNLNPIGVTDAYSNMATLKMEVQGQL